MLRKGDKRKKTPIDNSTKDLTKSGKSLRSIEPSSPSTENVSDDVCEVLPERLANGSSQKFVTRTKSKVVFSLSLSLVQVFVLQHYLVKEFDESYISHLRLNFHLIAYVTSTPL